MRWGRGEGLPGLAKYGIPLIVELFLGRKQNTRAPSEFPLNPSLISLATHTIYLDFQELLIALYSLIIFMLVLKFVHLLTVFKFVQRFCYLLSATSSQLIGLMVSKKHKILRNGCSTKSKFITCNCIVFFLGDHKPYEGSHAHKGQGGVGLRNNRNEDRT